MIKEVATFAAEELAPKGAELIAEVLPKLAGKPAAIVGRPALTAAESALPKIQAFQNVDIDAYRSSPAALESMANFYQKSAHESLLPQWSGGPTKFVDQFRYGIAPTNTPLETHGLWACNALSVTEREKGLQYLAHIDHDVTIRDIIGSISQFDLAKSSVRILPGPMFFESPNMGARVGAHINVEKTLSALQQIPNSMRDFKFLFTNSVERGEHYSIVTHAGEMYHGAPTPY